MTTTVRDLVRSSLRVIGAYAPGETPDASEEQDALTVLNDTIDTWRAHNLLIFQVKRSVYSTVGAQQSYTWGPSGDWIISNPNPIIAVSYMQSGNLEIPMTQYSVLDWQGMAVKTVSSTLPTFYYVEESWPNNTITFWPLPTGSGQAVIYYRNSIDEFLTLDDLVDLPNGYREALKYNLAVKLFSEYGRAPDPITVENARATLAVIKRANNVSEYMRSDEGVPGVGTPFNIFIGS